MQSYKSYYMVSPQTVFTYPFHHAKLQILLHGVTANSLYLSFSPCKATNLTTWCHHKQSLCVLTLNNLIKMYLIILISSTPVNSWFQTYYYPKASEILSFQREKKGTNMHFFKKLPDGNLFLKSVFCQQNCEFLFEFFFFTLFPLCIELKHSPFCF